MQPSAADQDGELRAGIDEGGSRGCGVLIRHRTLVDQEVRELEGDVVEHDRGDHLMSPEARLEETRNGRPDEAAEHAECEREWYLDDARQAVEAVAGQNPEDGAQIELSLGADVEEARAEPKRNRQAQKDVGDHRDQRLGKGPWIGERALEQGSERGDGIRAGDHHRNAGDDEARSDRDDWDDDCREKTLAQSAAHNSGGSGHQ